MIAAGAEVRSRWITDAELAAAPGLIKTMSVKPPTGTGRVRLIEIVGYDLQPCGGTHVRTTNEIGDVRVTQIEKKGKAESARADCVCMSRTRSLCSASDSVKAQSAA